MNNDIDKIQKNITEQGIHTPLERCWALRNYIGKVTSRYDLANDIGATVCDLVMLYQNKDKMSNIKDDGSKEYWILVKQYLIDCR